ncbi:MAG TPA: sugar phosphate isomerase/epimerase [Vicinamibacterales bacterium]|jgi:sugar phosphate isomerase/epimerase|nr:sugar phosphate isomerase/epimerase [Vicinamibacterales bacterium]
MLWTSIRCDLEAIMWSRREFLSTVGAGLALPAGTRAWLAPQEEIKTGLNGPVGLQMWSLREYLPNDLPGTLAKVRAMGFREVEGAGLWKRPVAELKAALDTAGLRCQSAHMGFERLRDDAPGAFAEAKALGATWVVCPWITHDKEFTRDDALKAADTFNKVGSAADGAGLRFAYHCHGYEMLPSPEGTRFDTLAQNTDPKRVLFQVDVFHALHGGGNPVDLINRYASRVKSLHLKDLKKGVAITKGTGTATPDVDVPLGTGQVDWPAVLRAAVKAGASLYYVEDESADPWGHIPQSLQYLKSVKL